MEHDKIADRLSEYRDGALDAADRQAVSAHLSGCADCSTLLADWELLSKAFLRRPPSPTVFQTEAFVARVAARLPGAAPAPLAWLTGRWLVPAIGLSFTMLAFSFRPYPGQEVSDPSSALLFASADRGISPAVSPADSSGSDAFGLVGEDR
jgi:anti-sigma factor RsiW